MLEELKRLSKETAVYGLSTVVGRLLNFLLLPLYTHFLVPSEYGVVATLFSYLAFLNVLYGHGMDFAFMRFFDPASEAREEACFSTAFWSLAATSLAVSALIHAFAGPLSVYAGVPPELTDVTRYAAWILAFDAAALVPFAYLRMTHRAGVYAGIKVVNIVMNLSLNIVFVAVLGMGVRGVFLASLVTACATLAILTPVFVPFVSNIFDRSLHKDLLRFALPLVPAGLASMMVQVIDRPILKFMTDDATVGLYQANYRLGIFMMMVVNMFDASWRPFFLQRAAKAGAGKVFGRVLTYWTAGASGLLILVSLFVSPAVTSLLFAGRSLIAPAYWPGLSIVPVVTLGYLFNGVYINMLVGPTLAKRSEFVAYATALGAIVNIGANLLWIPRWGMMGAAAATLAAYAAMAM
ncbi:MAG: oligosaccharide flippase family protein, partial [Elusimicrobia bacterium]|nr:oligosaccharide flippase family protein [Elusimicrobiota bacterium]